MENQADMASVLSDDVPVPMPELPMELSVNTAQQFKALGDSLRWRILGVIQYQPGTAKQIADTLHIAPGTIGHHLQVLESAGLVQIVARRLTHGILAKYYTRSARIFKFASPREVISNTSVHLDMMTQARDDLLETLAEEREDENWATALPRACLSPERVAYYRGRIGALIDEIVREAPDPEGQVYDLFLAFFKAPAYVQHSGSSSAPGDMQARNPQNDISRSMPVPEGRETGERESDGNQ